MKSLMILGRQPLLGLAELESLYGAAVVAQIGSAQSELAFVDIDAQEIDFDRLGGSLKLCKVLTILDTTDWQEIEDYLVKVSPEHAALLPEGKMQLGISTYNIRVTPGKLNATGLSLKKVIKNSDRSVRLVPNKENALNSASVLHNHLTGPTGWELVLARSGDKTILAQTVRVQDIESYTARDHGRPMRDARVGMLPPKLAQILINLATGNTNLLTHAPFLLDPFCGTGVMLQEASLMGIDVYGSDIDPRMVGYTDENMMWLLRQPESRVSRPIEYADDPAWRYFRLETGDATNHQWKPTPSVVASETYLGKPFTSLPSGDVLNQTISGCNLIIKKFLQNIGSQIKPGTRLCLAVPAWQVRGREFKHLPLLDQIGDMGYNRISFEHARNEDLIYHREGQIVARELLILEKL